MATEVKGLTTEDILADVARFVPPMRPEGLGVTKNELAKVGLSGGKCGVYLDNNNFIGVEMRCLNGRVAIVYMPPEDAEPYKDWIQ